MLKKHWSEKQCAKPMLPIISNINLCIHSFLHNFLNTYIIPKSLIPSCYSEIILDTVKDTLMYSKSYLHSKPIRQHPIPPKNKLKSQ